MAKRMISLLLIVFLSASLITVTSAEYSDGNTIEEWNYVDKDADQELIFTEEYEENGLLPIDSLKDDNIFEFEETDNQEINVVNEEWHVFMENLGEIVSTDKAAEYDKALITFDLESKSILNEPEERNEQIKGNEPHSEENESRGELIEELSEITDPSEAEEALCDTEYEVVETSEKTVTVIDSSVTRRLLVCADYAPDSFGAINSLNYKDYYILQYSTMAETKAAYEALSNIDSVSEVSYDLPLIPASNNIETEKCEYDRIAIEKGLLSPNIPDTYFWGKGCMGINSMMTKLNSLGSTLPTVKVAVFEIGGFNRTALNTEFGGRVLDGRTYTQTDGDGPPINYNAYTGITYQSNSHGNSVSSVILNSTTNNVKIVPITVCSFLAACAAINYCANQSIYVINMSFTGNMSTTNLVSFYDQAFSAANSSTGGKMVYIASAGNTGTEASFYPSASSHVIGVTGLQKNGSGYTFWTGSTYNSSMDFCAPAKDIGCFNGESWTYSSGTSFSAPYMTAAVALIKSLNVNYTKTQIYNYFKQSAVDLGTSGKDKYYGWGYINLNTFINNHKVSGVTINPNTVTIPADGSQTVSAVVTPTDAIDKRVIWASANTGIATVNSNGNIQGISYGKTTVSATPVDGTGVGTANIFVRYKDVNNVSEVFFKPVYWMAYNGITAGYNGNKNFYPNYSCTREQIATFLWRLAGKPNPSSTTSPFSDVPSSYHLIKPIMWAYEQGLISGYSDGTFRPTDDCTRVSVAVMMYRFANRPSVSYTTLPFSDISSYSNGIKKAIVWCYQQGIVQGYSDGTFRPEESCLRQQISIILFKYARKGITKWKCNGCNTEYTSESAAEAHYNAVNKPAHYGSNTNYFTATYSYPYGVSSSIQLIKYYYGYLPWGLS